MKKETSVKKPTDAELLEQYKAGNELAFREIVERYKNPLYSFLRRFLNKQDLVEDVFQETFLQLYTSRDKFDSSRPLHPWLFTIAANKAKDALRKMQRTSAMSLGAIALKARHRFWSVEIEAELHQFIYGGDHTGDDTPQTPPPPPDPATSAATEGWFGGTYAILRVGYLF